MSRLGIIVTVTAAAVVGLPVSAVAQARLTSGSNVRLRALPTADAGIVIELPLGTALQQTGEAAVGSWIPVRTEDGREGWILETLTRRMEDGQREQVIEEIIRQRLAREDDTFQAHAELVSFVETAVTAASSPEVAGSFTLYRLQALQRAAAAIPFVRQAWSARVAAWVRTRQAEIVYNEPGGSWMLSRDAILAAHDRYRATAAADEIAWLAATNGVPGECEGYLVCYLERSDLLEGEYLRREPTGRHVEEAIDQLRQSTQSLVEQLRSGIEFDPARDCTELANAVLSLRAAAAPAAAAGRTHLLEVFDRIARLCARQ